MHQQMTAQKFELIVITSNPFKILNIKGFYKRNLGKYSENISDGKRSSSVKNNYTLWRRT